MGEDASRTIQRWLDRSKMQAETQVAFFGGSFTCLDSKVQRSLLEAVQPFIKQGRVKSIRLSTRPDCLSEEICELIYSYGVRTVELGVQSMSDTVLANARRGHSAEDTRAGLSLLSAKEFEVGVQLMPGLPGETTGSFLRGVKELISHQPDFARLYPALVIENTDLAVLYENSDWTPLSMNRAITLSRRALELFSDHGINVIRMGLQPSVELEKQVVAGPYHPAFGELVKARIWYIRTRRLLNESGPGKTVTITVSDRDYSAFVGPNKKNLKRIDSLQDAGRLVVEIDKSLNRDQYRYAIN